MSATGFKTASLIACVVLFSSTAYGAEGDPLLAIGWLEAFQVAIPPIIIILVFFGIGAWGFGRMKKDPSVRRYEDHMDRVEQLLTRIADSVESKPGTTGSDQGDSSTSSTSLNKTDQ